MSSKNLGIIYILNNKNMPNLFKIGYTSRDVETRARELSSVTGVPGKFDIIQYWEISEANRVEKEIHKILDVFRVDKEFFKFDEKEKCIKFVEKYLISIGEIDANGKTFTQKQRDTFELESKRFLDNAELLWREYFEYCKPFYSDTTKNRIEKIAIKLSESKLRYSFSSIELELNKHAEIGLFGLLTNKQKGLRDEKILRQALRELESLKRTIIDCINISFFHNYWSKKIAINNFYYEDLDPYIRSISDYHHSVRVGVKIRNSRYFMGTNNCSIEPMPHMGYETSFDIFGRLTESERERVFMVARDEFALNNCLYVQFKNTSEKRDLISWCEEKKQTIKWVLEYLKKNTDILN